MPAQCVVTAPTMLHHRDATVGVVDSATNGQIEVLCDRNTSLNISIPSKQLTLRGGGRYINSDLRTPGGTATTVSVVAAPTAKIDLSNHINATVQTAGEFIGSTAYNRTMGLMTP